MKLTNFPKLRHAVNKMDAFEGVSLLAHALEVSEEYVDPDSLIFGSNGIYYLRPDGAITRVLFYRADKDVESEAFEDFLGTQFHHGGFDLDSVVQSLDRYHMVECPALVESALHDWPGEYCVTQRADGRFKYTYTRGSETLLDVEGQRLEPCPHCLERINKRRRKGEGYSADTFKPADFFSRSFAKTTTGIVVQDIGCRQVPDLLRPDWQRIEHAYMELCEYQCQGRECPHSDLSAEEKRPFMQAHYVQSDAQYSQFGFLRALCVHCHAKESGHGYLYKRVLYDRYERALQRIIDQRS